MTDTQPTRSLQSGRSGPRRQRRGRGRLRPLVGLLILGCSGGSGAPTDRELPALVAVPELDFVGLEPRVGEQLLAARSLLQASLANDRPDPVALGELFGGLGRLYLAYEFGPAARACFTNAANLAPEDFRWAYYLGHLLHEEGEPGQSRTHFERALQLNPQYLPAHVGLGELLIEANLLDEAEHHLQTARQLDPSGARALVGLGKIASRRRQHERAVEYLEAALRLDPAATESYYPLGMAHRALGDLQTARRVLERRGSGKARLDDPLLDGLGDLVIGARAYKQRGDYASLEGRFDAARTEYQRAVGAAPGDPEFRVSLAAALIELDHLDDAALQLREALRLAPQHGVANYNLGIVLARRGADEEALPYLLKALAADPNHRQAHFNLGGVLLRLRRFDEAAAHFARVVDRDPLNGEARFGQAVALMRLERWQEARALLEEGHGALPDHPQIANALARILAACPAAELRDGPRALEIAQRLVSADRSLHAIEVQAMALAEVGRFEEAAAVQSQGLAAARQARLSDYEARLVANLVGYRRRQPARTPLGE